MGCNYLPMPYVPVSSTSVYIFLHSVVSSNCFHHIMLWCSLSISCPQYAGLGTHALTECNRIYIMLCTYMKTKCCGCDRFTKTVHVICIVWWATLLIIDAVCDTSISFLSVSVSWVCWPISWKVFISCYVHIWIWKFCCADELTKNGDVIFNIYSTPLLIIDVMCQFRTANVVLFICKTDTK